MSFEMNVIFLVIVYAAFFLSCSKPEDLPDDYLTDSRDGKTYKIIAMGTQTWLAENLNYDAPGSKCYNDDIASCDEYGRLYDWETALTVCPESWHLPSDAEWARLMDYVGDSSAIKLNYYGFSFLLGGQFSYNGGFYGFGSYSQFWSSTEGLSDWFGIATSAVRIRTIATGYKNVGEGSLPKWALTSVRCLKNKDSFKNNGNSSSSNSHVYYGLIDERDPQKQQIYKTIAIGDQIWMAENLNYNAEGSKCYNDYLPNCDIYGRLYNWEMAMEFCPNGWHLPTDGEWAELEHFARNNPGTKLKATSGWKWNDWKDISGNGTDDYGFSALPSGPGGPDGDFSYGGNRTIWWSATEYTYTGEAYIRIMDYSNANIRMSMVWKSAFFSVRCIKD